VTQGLERLLGHLAAQGTLAGLGELVVTHEGLTGAQCERIENAAQRPVTMVQVPSGTGYYQAKNLGFAATRAKFVAFADSDCWPAQGWLEALFQPLLAGEVGVTAGRTCYRSDELGIAATTIDFMYFDSPISERATRNFYANNVAFERRLFEQVRYQTSREFYRGDCQVMGLVLQRMGIEVRFVPAARTTHRFPDHTKELVELRLRRGADSTVLAKHLFKSYLTPLEPLTRFRRLSGAIALGARWVFSVRSVNHQDMPEVHGLRRARVVGWLTAISALDLAGALFTRTGDREALSYHADVDRLRV
jgi:glycosyltransferase involved in cell wall biosynthesis